MVYKIECKECLKTGKKSVYIGESHRTLFDRSSEHEKNLRDQSTSSALYKHWQKDHQNMQDPPQFSHTVLKTFKTSTERQVYEAVMIENTECDQILNSKSEYRHNALVRQGIEYRGELWANEDESLADNNCQKSIGRPQTPPTKEGNEGSFQTQFKQRRAKRKADHQTETDASSNSTQNLGTNLSPQNTPRPDKSTQQSEDTTKHNLCDENEPHTLPRVQVYAKGKLVEHLRIKKRFKTS